MDKKLDKKSRNDKTSNDRMDRDCDTEFGRDFDLDKTNDRNGSDRNNNDNND